MAALGIICFKNLLTRNVVRNVRINRLITTSGKKKDSTGACPSPETSYKKMIDFSKPNENENWVSYGFDLENKARDTYMMHVFFFTAFTIVICGMGFIYIYYPDKHNISWARREAFIRLHEREQLGLEPIDPNYVDPSKIVLPPDEEIGEDDIII